MGASAAELVDVLTDLPKNLRALFGEWDGMPEELREHYKEDLEWLLRTVKEKVVYEPEQSSPTIRLRYYQAWSDLVAMRKEIFERTGIVLLSTSAGRGRGASR